MINSNKCNINFQSKFAYINNESIHIDNINNDSKSKCNLKCKLGHESCANTFILFSFNTIKTIINNIYKYY